MAENRFNILLVEDNPGDARLISEMLVEHQGSEITYKLVHVPRLKEALERCARQPFDVVLLDLNLPDTQGLDTLKKFNESFADIPIIVLTGLNDNAVSSVSVEYGALNYVVKGECNGSLLVRVIQYAIERKRVEQHFKYLATHDALTGLPNRTLYYDRLSHAIHHTERTRMGQLSKWKLAVMLVDLDHFKAINDRLGHAQGDATLRQCARRMQNALRESDTIARLGGDEFVMLIEGVEDQEDCLAVAMKLLRSLGEPVLLEGGQAVVHASIGVSIFPDHAQDVETLIRCADTAMYAAKQERNRICFFKEDCKG